MHQRGGRAGHVHRATVTSRTARAALATRAGGDRTVGDRDVVTVDPAPGASGSTRRKHRVTERGTRAAHPGMRQLDHAVANVYPAKSRYGPARSAGSGMTAASL